MSMCVDHIFHKPGGASKKTFNQINSDMNFYLKKCGFSYKPELVPMAMGTPTFDPIYLLHNRTATMCHFILRPGAVVHNNNIIRFFFEKQPICKILFFYLIYTLHIWYIYLFDCNQYFCAFVAIFKKSIFRNESYHISILWQIQLTTNKH